MQQEQVQKLIEIRTLVNTTITSANDATPAVATIRAASSRALREQESDKVVAPMVGVGTRIDNLSNDVRSLQRSMADLASSIAKIQRS